MKNIRVRFLIPVAFACVISILPSTSAHAATVLVDVCRYVFDRVLVPPTYKDLVSCNTDWKVCLLVDPSCCTPVVCNTLPHCLITQKVVDVAAHWEDQWVYRCGPVSIEEAWKLWLREQIPSLDSAVLPGAFDVARADIEAMRAMAIPLPARVSTQVTGLLQAFTTAGTSKVTANEIANARIISDSNSNADLYLRDGFAAITLYDVIVINDADYRRLVNAANSYSVATIQSGGASSDYVDALLLVIHELVHVRQYSSLGFQSFLTNYLMETIAKGYGSDSFEREAYQFEANVAGTIAGSQAVELEQIRATASALAIDDAVAMRNIARWRAVDKWFRDCVGGKQMQSAGGRAVPIAPPNCVAETVRQFGLQAERAANPRPAMRAPTIPATKPVIIKPVVAIPRMP